MKKYILLALFLIQPLAHAASFDDQFEAFKKQASPEELYHFLYAMPKGGDLHNHLSGSNLSDWWYDLAIKEEKNGYIYYTKVKINNCKYGSNEYGGKPYLMMFVNLQESEFEKLDDCEKAEYKRLQDLTDIEKQAWKNSIRLDKPSEGRQEFFGTHWTRLGDLNANPYLTVNMLVKNMQAFSQEGLLYLETQTGVKGFKHPDGSPFDTEEVYNLYQKRLADKDVLATGMSVRFQYSLLRFLPDAEEQLKWMYGYVASHPDLYVAVNMVGREDNDKGYPLRFLSTLRELRHKYHGVMLSIHAGEVDEPNEHIRDTLLLGAERIGHGVNLITDPDTMLLMRYSHYMVEINLISNLLLEYVSDYSQHPFPEYLRVGIPVALSTDDRGMWDSNMTDEYYMAVTQFNLSWSELVKTGLNSLEYSFIDDTDKAALMKKYSERMKDFENLFSRKGLTGFKNIKPVSYSFACKYYKICRQ